MTALGTEMGTSLVPLSPCPIGCELGMTSAVALTDGRLLRLVKLVIFYTLLGMSQLAITPSRHLGRSKASSPKLQGPAPPLRQHMVPVDGFPSGLKDMGNGSIKSTGSAGDAAEYPGHLSLRDGAGLGRTLLAEGFISAATR